MEDGQESDPKERFIHAVAFCLAYDQYEQANATHDENVKAAHDHLGEYRALAEWALTPSDEQAKDPLSGDPESRIALVTGGATKIKSYVFESARLPEIRGASGLLDRINLEDHRELWSNGIGCAECLIYANGGEALGFAPTKRAAWLADKIERIYTKETLVAQSVAVHRFFTLRELKYGLQHQQPHDQALVEQLLGYDPLAKPGFGSLVTTLNLAKFRRREANPDDTPAPTDDPEYARKLKLRGIAHFETVPFARRCSSCERRAAVVNAIAARGEEPLPLCEPCARKRAHGQLIKSGKEAAIQWFNQEFIRQFELKEVQSWSLEFSRLCPDVDRVEPPDDLNEIGEAAQPQGFVGVVYADGNNMGALLEELKTPTAYHDFAEEVYDATKRAVFESLKVNLEKTGSHPFEILSIGGDDFFLIVPAQVALPLACAIASQVESRLLACKAAELFSLKAGEPGAEGYDWGKVQRCQGQSPKAQCKVSLSAGVVIADAHTPIFYLQELAEQLLKSAKRRAKQLKRESHYYGGTIDFLALKSVTAISGTVEQFRQATASYSNPERRLYARPYTIAEMEKMLATIRLLKRHGFPRNQLHRLRQSLHQGVMQSTLDYLYFLSRSAEVRVAREKIEQGWPSANGIALHPWRNQLEDNRHLETIWDDVMELYDFAHEEEYAEHQD